jgi:hypothetical protein
MAEVIFIVAARVVPLAILMLCVKHLVWNSDLIAGCCEAELEKAYT